MIVESIVTTLDAEGRANVAPMGVEWDGASDTIVLKPFLETTTFRNLARSGHAVVNLTDDVRIFAAGAIGSAAGAAEPALVPAERVAGAVLAAACSWREVEVTAMDATPPRARITARVVHGGTRRDFVGFNRAAHAVLEGAILATRTHLIPADEIRADVARLQVLVDKTAGPREREAWELVTAFLDAALGTREPAP